MPFGEYVPLKKWLPFLGKIVAQVGDFHAGPPGGILEYGGHRIGHLICYDGIFPNLARAAVNNGADLLVNLTNDAWYLSLIHISEPTRPPSTSRMPSSA